MIHRPLLPIDHKQVLLHFLSAHEPCGHLWVLILSVCRAVCIFSKVNVEAFGLFSIVIVCCAEQSNRRLVMDQAVEFGDIELLSHSKVDEDRFILMKSS
jgi:hypothetical protein